MSIDWDLLRTARGIERTGSMLGAAQALGLDRATVARHLDALESSLGARLFERRRDGCRPTPVGRRALELIGGMDTAAERLTHLLGGTDTRLAGRVRITCPEFVAHSALAPELPRFFERYPEINLDIATGLTTLDLVAGEADIAIRYAHTKQATLVSRTLGGLAYGVYASKAYLARHGAPKPGFRGHRLVLPELAVSAPGFDALVEAAKDAVVSLRASETLPLWRAVQAGVGIGIIPCVVAAGDPEVRLIAPGIVGRTRVLATTHKESRRLARVRAVLDFLTEVFKRRSAVFLGEKRGGGARGGAARGGYRRAR